MIFNQLPLKGAYLIEVQPFQDNRGFFTRTFCEKEFASQGLVQHYVQANHSGTQGKGVVRGMHFQYPPFTETKLIKCIQGAIFDVIIDVRKGSPTFLQWYGAELSSENKKMMYVPTGFAHGFQSLSDYSEITYMVSNFYSRENEGGINYHDPMVKISWPLSISLVSEKDKNLPFIDNSFKAVTINND